MQVGSSIKHMLTAVCESLGVKADMFPESQCGDAFIVRHNDKTISEKELVVEFLLDFPFHISK